MSDRPVLVTGAGGFIGRTVVERLRTQGIPVRAHIGPPKHDHAPLPADVETHEAEITDAHAFQLLTQHIRAVIHCAGPPQVSESWQLPSYYIQSHIQGTSNLLEACACNRVSRFVMVSSAEVYGRPQHNPVPETAPMLPLSPYGIAKQAAEQLVHLFATRHHFDAMIARPFSTYGPGMTRHSLVGTIGKNLQDSQPMQLNDLRPVRDFLFVDDLAEALFLAVTLELKGVHTVNLGSGRGISVADLAQTALKLAQRNDVPTERTNARRPEDSEIFELIADIRQAASLLHWTPRTNLESGLQQTLKKDTSCVIS